MARHTFFIRLRVVFTWAAFIAAGTQLYMTGGIQLLLIGLLWGIGPAVGMQNGVRGASVEAWNRKQTRNKSSLGLVLLAAIVFFPAIVALYFGEFLAALLFAIFIVFGMAVVGNLCNVLFGPIKPPGGGSCADQPQNS